LDYYIDILQEMLRYIDSHIKEKMSVEKLAAKAGFSPYHFCRMFQWGVGYSMMEYVRNRKLAFAASELNSGRKIIEISFAYNFETHSGFSKAFRRYFGCSPEQYRKHASFDVPKLPILKQAKQYVSGGIVMEPKMAKKETIKLAGFAIKTKMDNEADVPKFWQDYLKGGRCEKLHSEFFLEKHTEYGACFTKNMEIGEMEYVIGVEAKTGCDIPNGYHVCVLPEALYAVFTTPPADNNAAFVSTICGTWDYIYSEWFPNSGYEFANSGVDFGLYDERYMVDTGKVIDIYVPVVKKSCIAR
jgi:AraC family transcriptional regulator